MLKAFQYRIYPDSGQSEQMEKTFGCVRFVYNHYLEKKKTLYDKEQKSISKTDCNNDLNHVLKMAAGGGQVCTDQCRLPSGCRLS